MMAAGKILLWLLCCLGTAGLYCFAASLWTMALAAAVMVLPPLLLLPLSLSLRKVKVCLSAPETAAKGETVTLRLTLKNGSFFPLPEVYALLAAENLLTGEQIKKSVRLSAGVKRGSEAELKMSQIRCGLLRISVEQIRAYEPFGVFSIKKTCGEYSETLTLPDTFEPNLLLPQNSSDFSDCEQYAPDRPGRDFAETFQIRDYREGDSPKQIHWKLSAKRDTLISRDPALPLDRRVLLFWERGCPEETPAQTEALAEALISVCRSLLRQKIICRIAWNEAKSEGCADCLLTEEEELYELLPIILRAGKASGSGAERFARLHGAEKTGKTLCFTSEATPELEMLCKEELPTVLLCGEGETRGRTLCFDPENLTETLAEIDLN